MTLLLLARYVFLAALVGLVVLYMWAEVPNRE